ncbi:hypothetical protein AYI69_g7470 [Smittium culicis]|uniref:DUF3020 domain-containing protein n=1 Tax=Smittium culicis TaxID=133412 RepID=A0A1R1XHU6_9FUNG|nr:hypothetical protein AYI69_g8692 [Smittium culicis]OMJ17332.1 hypothetical protein AYI69_g7470 [Smittium culicis]
MIDSNKTFKRGYNNPMQDKFHCLRFLSQDINVAKNPEDLNLKTRIEHDSRVRRENRERKKKWRMMNVEKNKNIDLRCRIKWHGSNKR